jgi:chromosome partitioning protein
MTFRTASGWGARREARSLARDFDFVIVDTPPKSDSEARPAIEAADLVAARSSPPRSICGRPSRRLPSSPASAAPACS